MLKISIVFRKNSERTSLLPIDIKIRNYDCFENTSDRINILSTFRWPTKPELRRHTPFDMKVESKSSFSSCNNKTTTTTGCSSLKKYYTDKSLFFFFYQAYRPQAFSSQPAGH